MTVKDIVEKVAVFLDRKDILEYLKTGATENYLSVIEDVNLLVNCYNVVGEEIASLYYRFKTTERLSPNLSGVIKIADFKKNPLAIISVKDVNGNKVNAKILPSEIITNLSEVVIDYYYVPDVKNLEDISDFTGTSITDRILCYGVLTEYYLIKGGYEEANLWHGKYINALKNKPLTGNGKRLKGRVWQWFTILN